MIYLVKCLYKSISYIIFAYFSAILTFRCCPMSTASWNFIHSNRKAWNFVKRLGAEILKISQSREVKSNAVATRIMRVANANMDI